MAGENDGDDAETVSGDFKPLYRTTEHFNVHVSGEALQDLLGVSHETIRRLTNDGKLVKIGRGRYDFLDSVEAYLASLRDVASGRGGGAEQANLAVENALLARARREAQELKNEELRAQLVSVVDVERIWAETIAGLRTAMLTLPSRVAFALPHISRKDLNEIDAVVRRLLEDAAHDRVDAAGSPAPRPDAPGAAGEDEALDVD